MYILGLRIYFPQKIKIYQIFQRKAKKEKRVNQRVKKKYKKIKIVLIKHTQ